jgi:hypothetical protein
VGVGSGDGDAEGDGLGEGETEGNGLGDGDSDGDGLGDGDIKGDGLGSGEPDGDGLAPGRGLPNVHTWYVWHTAGSGWRSLRHALLNTQFDSNSPTL